MDRLFKITAIFLFIVTNFGMNTGSVWAASSQANVIYVPLRFICEAEGASVNWEDASQTATVTS